jgi:DNA-binding NarL/FixJ family response regulator
MPGKEALDVLKEIKTKWSSMPVVIFSMNSNEMYAVRMLSNGASAFINKETKPTQIIEILRIVLSGKRYISPQQAEILVENASIREKPVNTSHELLTDREFQIFCLLANGTRKSEIAEKLEISINTLSNHRNNILKKMKMSINSDLTRYAIHAGIIQ